MSIFRTKNKKITLSDQRITLDASHNEMMNYFEQLQNSLIDKYEQLRELENEYNILIQNNPDDYQNKYNFEEKIENIRIEIQQIENREEEKQYFLKTSHILYRYYENQKNSNLSIQSSKQSPVSIKLTHKDQILENQILENQIPEDQILEDQIPEDQIQENICILSGENNNIHKNKNLLKPLSKKNKKEKEIKNNVLHFFMINDPELLKNSNNNEILNINKLSTNEIINIEKQNNEQNSGENNEQNNEQNSGENISKINIENDNNLENNVSLEKQENPINPDNSINQLNDDNLRISNYFNLDHQINKEDLVRDYMRIIDPNNQNMNFYDRNYFICPTCNIEKNVVPSEGIMVCVQCGSVERIIIDSEKPSYKDPPHEVSYFAYKRINHFSEWLSQFQAKESTDIPQEVYDKILIEIRKERIKNPESLSHHKIREYLKKLKLNKYYEHVPHILNKINGISPPTVSREIEERLRFMFKEIQAPFIEVCPKNRKNFLSYSYVLHKFVELLGLNEYKKCFPLLKSREKLHQQDMIWKEICNRLGWPFHKSI